MVQITRLYFFHCDPSGAPTQVTAHDGTVTWRASYDGWGLARAQWDDVGASQPLRYQGQFRDSETGLYYNQHRHYDPDIGRFVTQDPVRLRGGVHPYRYAPNPNRWSDPLGLQGVSLNMAGPLYETWASTITHSTDYFSVLAHGNPSGLDLPLHDRTRGHASVGEVARWRNSRGEQYFKALCGCDSL